MPIPDNEKLHVEVKIFGELAALGMSVTQTVNLLHYRRTNNPVDLNLANFINAWQATVQASWLAAVSASWTLVKLGARCINDATDAGSEEVVGSVGGVAGECLPGFNNMLITKETALRGQSYRGRAFINGVPEGGVDGNTLTAAQLALLATLAGVLDNGFTDSDGNSFVPFLVSTSQSQLEENPTEVIGTDITTCTAKDPVSVLRSRKARA